MELEILHTTQGDKKKRIDTSNDAGRREAQRIIMRELKRGAAIFLERGKRGKTYRVKGYDAKSDRVIVQVVKKEKAQTVTAKSSKGKMTAVAPVRGG